MMQETETVKLLNSLLRGEMAASETYRQALSKVTNAEARPKLEQAQLSHQQRIAKLQQRIQQLGGKPAEGAGPWGAFAKVVEGGALVFGEKAAISALEEGEDHGLKEYQADLKQLDSEIRQWLSTELLPAAEQTHSMMSVLKRTLN